MLRDGMADEQDRYTGGGSIVLASIVGLVSLGLFVLFASLDAGAWPRLALESFASPGSGDALIGYGEVAVGVLAVAVTVVSIIVELAASRFSHRVVDVFLRDAVALVGLAFYVVTCLLLVWTGLALADGAYGDGPSLLVGATTLALSTSLLSLLPYFTYVFDLLRPRRIIERMEARVRRSLSRALASPADAARLEDLFQAIAELGELAMRSTLHKDKALASQSVNALTTMTLDYIAQKPKLPDAWFRMGGVLRADADFVAYHGTVIRQHITDRTGLEMKVLLQLFAAYREASDTSRELEHLMAIEVRQLGVAAAELGDVRVVDVCLRFLNSMMRSAINRKVVRTAFNVLGECRQLAEGVLGTDAQPLALRIGESLRSYGQTAFQRKMPFVLETAAHDLCTLVEVLAEVGGAEHDPLLDILLEVDREPGASEVQEASLLGVRRAQVRLATFYLAMGDDRRAVRIVRDVEREPQHRLDSIRAELEASREEMFWEVSDRGVDMNWLPPNRRRFLAMFFEMVAQAKAGELADPVG